MKKIISMKTALTMVLILILASSSYAYFERGTVGVSLGQNSVSLEQGKSISISVGVNPSESKQLAGCGMAECPQTCGEGCLNKDGECTCAGTDYQTYKTNVTSTSSNANVARASYSNGVLNIKALAEGTAVITVKASLRQFNEGSARVEVRVSRPVNKEVVKKAEPPKQIPSVNQPKDQKSIEVSQVDKADEKTDKTKVVDLDQTQEEKETEEIVPVEQEQVETDNEAESTKDPGEKEKSVVSHKGKVKIFQLEGVPVKREEFNRLLKESEIVSFEQSDPSGNPLYSFTFKGKDVVAKSDIDMTIDISNSVSGPFKKYLKGKNPLFLSYAHSGELPGKASIYVKVADHFSNGDKLNLYYCKEDTQKTDLVERDIIVENGYVSFEIDHCSNYFLSQEDNKTPLIIGVSIIVLALIGLIIFKKYKKK